jgi:hypothetical protein
MRIKSGFQVFIVLIALASSIHSARADDKTVNKTVIAGQTIKLVNMVAVNPDCSPGDPVNVSIFQMPSHGTAGVSQGEVFPNFVPTNPRFMCNRNKYPSSMVEYTAPSGFSGTDLMTVEFITSSGNDTKVNFLITVK